MMLTMESSVTEHNRSFVRKRVGMVLEMQDKQTLEKIGRLMDISEGGFMLLAKREMIPNQKYELVLNLPEAIKFHRSIELTAECRWCQPSNTSGYVGAGFSVVSVDFSKREAWKQLAEEF